MRLRAGFIAVALIAGRVEGQGFALNEVGTCAVTRGFATTSSPCADGSAVFWNPGALTALEGLTISAGVARISIDATFTRDTSRREYEGDEVTEYPPHLFAAYRVSPRLALGAGVYVPYGLTSAWRSDFPGRFIARRASLSAIYVQPSVAFAMTPDWSIGGGPVIGHSTVELSQALDLSAQTLVPGVTFGLLGVPRGTEFARASLEGTAMAIGFNAGLHGRIGAVEVGVRYLSAMEFEFDDATARFEQVETDLTVPADAPIPGGPTVPAGTPVDALLAPQFVEGGALSAQGVRTSLTNPWQMQGGLTVPVTSRTLLSAEIAVMGWSSFDVLPVEFENPATPDQMLIEDYETSWVLRLGGTHHLANGWEARAGFAYAESPAPDESVTPLLPDQERYNFGLGVGIPVADGWMVDLGYLRAQGAGRRGRLAERHSRDETAESLNEGFYELGANVIAIGVRYGGSGIRDQGSGGSVR